MESNLALDQLMLKMLEVVRCGSSSSNSGRGHRRENSEVEYDSDDFSEEKGVHFCKRLICLTNKKLKIKKIRRGLKGNVFKVSITSFCERGRGDKWTSTHTISQAEYGPHLRCYPIGDTNFKILYSLPTATGSKASSIHTTEEFEFVTPSRFQRDVLVLTLQARSGAH